MKPIEKIVDEAEKAASGGIIEKQDVASGKQARLLFHELSELAKIVGEERAVRKELESRIAALESKQQVPF